MPIPAPDGAAPAGASVPDGVGALVPPGGGTLPPGPVLAVYAHPDDETLQAGPLLALAAAQPGRRVIVVTATRGERGEMIGAPRAEGTADVAPWRARERDAALDALGVGERYFLDELTTSPDGAASPPADSAPALAATPTVWTDSGMRWLAAGLAGPAADAPPTALSRGDLPSQARALARFIAEVRPAVVLCDEPGGAYGHPDHVRTHEIASEAVRLAAGDEAARPWRVPLLAWVVQDADRLAAARAALLVPVAQADARDWQGYPLRADEGQPSIAREAEDIDIELDARPALPRVLAALRAYGSQVQGATIPELDHGGRRARSGQTLRTTQAAVGWYALSNSLVQPIFPVVGLQAAPENADLAALALGTDVRADAPVRPVGWPVQGGPSTARLALRGLGGLVLGVGVGGLATIVHRLRPWEIPFGLLLALLLVTVGGMLARSLARGAGLVGYGLGVLGVVQVLAFAPGGGSVIVPGDWIGLTWLLLSIVGVGIAVFVPRRWVGESP